MTSVIQPWIGISKVFAESGLKPVMWICAPNMQQEVGERFPDCEIIDSFEINKTQALFGEDLPHHPPKDMLLRVEFLRLKEQVMKMMDRQDDAAVYRRLEREAVFYSLFCYLYSKVAEKRIGLLVSAEAPHFPAQRILHAICQFLDIPCVHFQATRVAPLVFMLSDLHGSRVKLQRDHADTQVLERIVADYVKAFSEKKSWEEPLYVRQRRAEDAQASSLLAPIVRTACKGQLKTALRLALQRLRPHYWRNSITQLYTVYSPLFLEDERLPSIRQAWRIHRNRKGLKKQLLRHYEELAVNVDMQVPYVYFPLHYEPERTTNPDGGYYYNTHDALIALRDVVPSDIPIYVKEHVSQFSLTLPGHRGRSPYFYRSIAGLPNVKLVKMEHASFDLMNNAQVTAAITGTACFEAASMGKKAIIFGHPWFEGSPNIFAFDSLDTYEQLLDAPIADADAIAAFFAEQIRAYAIRGCINIKVDKYFRDKFPEADSLLNYDVMAQDVLAGLRSLGVLR